MIPAQEVIHSQENSIRELLKAVTDQSDQLNLQRVKIKALEEKVSRGRRSMIGESLIKAPPLFGLFGIKHEKEWTVFCYRIMFEGNMRRQAPVP